MSSADPIENKGTGAIGIAMEGSGRGNARGRFRSLSVLAAAVTVLIAASGCQVRPLYAEADGSAAGKPAPQLAAIDIEEPETRAEQVFRNALTFGITGGAAEAPPQYRLGYRMVIEEQQLGVEEVTGTPRAYQVSGRISFILEDHATGRPIMSDQVTAVASFDRSSQNFANIRARRDAVDRLSKALAAQVETRLATFFATT